MVQINPTKLDHSTKIKLARGCDPITSSQFSKLAPSLLGGSQYTATTDDINFLKQLKMKKWAIVFLLQEPLDITKMLNIRKTH